MMNSNTTNLPQDIASVALRGISRASVWVFGQFMIAPARHLGLGAFTLALAFSASNALFWQTSVHPAPMFGIQSNAMSVQNGGEIVPDLIAPHPLELAVSRASRNVVVAPNIQQTEVAPVLNTGSVPNRTVSNEELANAQRVLAAMGVFGGKVDGFYGPLTAQAIRAFELSVGLPPKGAMTADVIARINNAPTSIAPALLSSGETAPVATVSPVAQQPQTNPALTQLAPVPPQPIAQPAPDVLNNIVNSVAQEPNSTPVTTASRLNPSVDKSLIEEIQRSLASLGFYTRSIDGIAGDSTAKAIREFENFKSYNLTGRISTELLDWLKDAGAST